MNEHSDESLDQPSHLVNVPSVATNSTVPPKQDGAVSTTLQNALDEAWAQIIQHKANADAAIADKRWADAQMELGFLRWEASNAEEAAVMILRQQKDGS